MDYVLRGQVGKVTRGHGEASGRDTVQRCKSERSSCAKVQRRRQRYSGTRGARALPEAGRIESRYRFARRVANGRDAVAPLPTNLVGEGFVGTGGNCQTLLEVSCPVISDRAWR